MKQHMIWPIWWIPLNPNGTGQTVAFGTLRPPAVERVFLRGGSVETISWGG